jgi:deoxyribodipyrimidine photo-lyase
MERASGTAGMDCAIVLFNRDLRVHDHPALQEALVHARVVVPLFVLDPQLARGAVNRVAFLLDCLSDLRIRLRERGGDLVVARGNPVDETMRIAGEHGARAVFASADVTPYARAREARLAEACGRNRLEWRALPGITVVPPGQLTPSGGGDHYRVFSPYWRAWRSTRHRSVAGAPRRVPVPEGLRAESIPALGELVDGTPSPDLPTGGESAARSLLRSWGRGDLARYDANHDDLAADRTSRVSPYLHFGCVSPLELAARFDEREGGEAFVRQLCWRDFFHQVSSAFGALSTEDYRRRGTTWRNDADDLEAWRQGRTGYPVVDAGLRQLRREGWMHNRARLITASFLTKDLAIDWRAGAAHFMNWLVDGDVAVNSGNWQWVAGTGNDTRPNRLFNPLRQAERFDPSGDYVRRYVPELAEVAGPAVHRPWDLDPVRRAELDYPERIVDHDDVVAQSRASRGPR